MKNFRNVYVLTFCVFLFFAGCAISDSSGTNGRDWIKETLKAVESLPVKQRYQKIIESVANGCQCLPLNLKEAAKQSLGQDSIQSKRTLMLAAAPYISKECISGDLNIAANKLLHICFEEEWPEGDFSGMIKYVDAATYLYCRALKKEFEKAGLYDEYGKKLLFNLLISNAELRESD
jgi:hypothetical protein